MKRQSSNIKIPILYSFRRCPFAIRARSAIYFSNTKVELREVVLSNKPNQMLIVSPKATVPVLQLENTILEESLDIMLWALKINDPLNLLAPYHNEKDYVINLINTFDFKFKFHLDRYKYFERYIDDKSFMDKNTHRNKALIYLRAIEQTLSKNNSKYMYKNKLSILDLTIFPLIRQFMLADQDFFNFNKKISHVKYWLDNLINSVFFNNIMYKYTMWKPEDEPILFYKM